MGRHRQRRSLVKEKLMAKKYKNMNTKELTSLCQGRFVFKKKPTKKEMVDMLERSDRVKAEPELSETPVIEGEQATAPVPTAKLTITPGGDSPAEPLRDDEQGTPPTKPHEPMTTDIPTTQRPEVIKEPEPTPISVPVICSGCKATVESSTTRACPHCSGSLVFCLNCAKPGSCHKCGKALSK